MARSSTTSAADLDLDRLVGRRLRVARLLAEQPLSRRLLLPRVRAAYRLDELFALPADARAFFEIEPRPRAGAPPRRWDDQGLPPLDGAVARLAQDHARGRRRPSEVLADFAHAATGRDFGRATYSPFVALDLDRAARAAAESDARHAAGAPRSPLDGVPVVVKDEHDMVGLPNGAGTRYRTRPATTDSFVVAALRGAGAILPARTHSTEWGMNPLGQAAHVDLPRNPYAADRAAGGSSTGSGVAVALGLAPLALGSDGGGSIRIPASLCGIMGIKPTLGRVGRTGDIFGGGSMTAVGPLARHTADLVELLAVIAAHPDPDDSTTSWAPARAGTAATWRAALGRGVRGARIGIPEGEWRDAAHPVQVACQEAVRALEAEGARLVDVRIPHVDLAPAVGVAVIGVETMGCMTDELAAHRGAMGDELRLQLAMMSGLSAREHMLAVRTRATLRRRLARLLAGLDLLALPAAGTPAPPYLPGERAVCDDAATRAVGRFCFLANITGLPAGSVPVGMAGGLPLGLQLVGDAWDEASIFAGMAACERIGLCALPPPPRA